MIATFLLLYCYIGIISVSALIKETSVLFKEDEKVKDLYISSNSKFTIYLVGSPNSMYYWALENLEEVKNSNIEPLNLVSTYKDADEFNYDNIPNKGEILSLKKPKDDVSESFGFFKFSFQVNNSTLKNLPQLNFVYKFKMDIEEDNEVRAQVNLLANPSGEINKYFSSQNVLEIDSDDIDEEKEYTLQIDNNSDYLVKIEDEFTYDNYLIGSSWHLTEEQLNESKDLIEVYRGTEIKPYESKYKIIYSYHIKSNDLPAKELLPILSFTFKESEGDNQFKKSIIVYLRKKGDFYISVLPLKDKKKNITVQKNEVIAVEFPGAPGAGYGWFLDNADVVRASNAIEALNINDSNYPPFNSIYSMPSTPGYYIFKFLIKETAESGKLPTLHFIEAKGTKKMEVKNSFELTLEIKKERTKEELTNSSLPVIDYNDEDDIVYVESNVLLRVAVDDNPSTGRRWVIVNQDEINRSNFIDLAYTSYKSNCNMTPPAPGCGGTTSYYYRIWEVTEEDDIPNINMVQKFQYGTRTDDKTINIQLKVKSKTTECSLNGYKCCSKTDAKVYYQDKDGDWSIENGEWCIIKKDKEDLPKLIRTCEAEKIGYPCCDNNNNKVVYTDSDGQWGLINGKDWCLMNAYSCVYTGNYPVCKNTTEIIYSDTEKWGVENNEWCVLCL